MKTVSTTVKIHTGLPNYSHRATEVTVVADEDESLDIQDTVRYLSKQIRAAWETTPKAHTVEQASYWAFMPGQVEIKTPKKEAAEKEVEKEVYIEPDTTPQTPPKRRGRPPKNSTPEPVVEEEFVSVTKVETNPAKDAVDDILG